MNARRLYGLGIEADVPIAALLDLPRAPRCDVRWSLRSPSSAKPRPPDAGWRDYRRVEESCLRVSHHAEHALYRMAYDDGTVFLVDAKGTHVWSDTPSGATLEDTATYLLGPVMGFVLRLRGVTCLHASAIAVHGRAVVFAGHAGAGKSTLAASFARQGHAVLSEDVTALTFDADGLHVEPAYPLVRLWPESVAALFGARDALPLISPNWAKRCLGLAAGPHRFQERRLPLAAVYLIAGRRPGAASIMPLEPGQALMGLVERAYSAHLLDPAMRAREFDVLARVVAGFPIFTLILADAISELPRLCEAIAQRHESNVAV
jgi:hypothetical protein